MINIQIPIDKNKIIEFCKKWQIKEFSKKTFADYSENKMIRLAVERLLEIIGQAAKEISLDFRTQYPKIPWPQIIGLRSQE